jgi:hypothetical protein
MSYADYVDKPTDDKFARLGQLANAQRAAEQLVEQCQKSLKRAQDALRTISESELPELMDELGLQDFSTTDGLTIEVRENIRAGISKERGPAAYAWLRSNGHSRLIKHSVTVEFSKDEDDKAKALVERLAKDELQAEDRQAVHPSTLQAFVKQKLQAGEDLPLELFGVHRQRVAKIK